MLLNIIVVCPVFKSMNRKAFARLDCPAFQQLPRMVPGLNSTGLEVIVVHPGHMGSSSVALALEAMGLRTYGSSELFSYSTYMIEDGDVDAYLVGVMRSCRVKAFNADDWYTLLPTLVNVSPGVKIIQLNREWAEWSASASAARHEPLLVVAYHLVARFLLCNWLPYGLVWPDSDVGKSLMTPSTTAVLFSHCFRALDDLYRVTGSPRQFDMLANSTAFREASSYVRSLVPPSRMMEFDIKNHGWAEIAEFLLRPVPPASKPFPRAKSGGQYRFTMYWRLFLKEHLAVVALMLAMASLNWLLFLTASLLVQQLRQHLGSAVRRKHE